MDRDYFKQNICHPAQFHGTVSHVLDVIINTVGATYGPGGTHNIFMFDNGGIRSSKDGLENLSMMRMDNSIARMVHQMALEIAQRQASNVGDGTTSAILVMAYVYKQLRGNKEIWKKYTPSSIYKAMQYIQSGIVNILKSESNKLKSKEDIFNLVYTSTDRNKELTDTIIEAFSNIPDFEDFNIMIDYSATDKSYFSMKKGLTINGKVMNPGFNNYDIETCKLKNVKVLAVDGALIINNDIFEYANKLGVDGKSLLVICSGVKNENFVRHVELLRQRQPEFLRNLAVVYSTANSIQDKDAYHDLIRASGCSHVEEGFEFTMQNIENVRFGYVENVVIKDRKVTISGFNESEELRNYIQSLEDKIKELESLNENPEVSKEEVIEAQFKINNIKSRIAKLKHGIVTVFVGGDTNQRKNINYRLAEDGIKALQSALKTGYFVGCNVAVLNTIYQLLIAQNKANNFADNIFTDLLRILLNAYIEVYKKLIKNRLANITDKEFFEYILYEDAKSAVIFEGNEANIVIDTNLEGKPVFGTVNISDDELANTIINPAATDIQIVEQSIDAALVLATANTIMTDVHNEWESTSW